MPDVQIAHIDVAMTDISVAFIQDESSFIAPKVFPQIGVSKQSNIWFSYSRADFFRNEMKDRAQATESAGTSYEVKQEEPYFCKKKALHMDITKEERLNYDTPLAADQDAVIFLTQKALLEREVTWANTYFKKGVWANEITGVDQTPSENQCLKWTNPLSTPIEDVNLASVEMASKTGFRPNKMVLTPRVFYALKNHEDILDRIKYTQKGIVTTDLLATLFEVNEVLVAWAVQNNNVKGKEENNDFIMGNHALLIYVAPAPALRTPSAGYIFAWTGLEGAGAYGNRMVRMPMDMLGLGTERIEIELAYDTKVVCKDLGTMFLDVA